MGNFTTFIILVAVCIIFYLFISMFKRYIKCPSDKILVIYGSTGAYGYGACKCIHGGSKFILPIVQDYAFLDLTPFTLSIDLRGALTYQNIRVNVPACFTIGITTDERLMPFAAERLLNKPLTYIQDLVKDIILGEMRLIIAQMSIEELNSEREKLLALITHIIGKELAKMGLHLFNANITDIRDESGCIEALNQPEAAKALNDAKILVADQNRVGHLKELEINLKHKDQVVDIISKELKNLDALDRAEVLQNTDLKSPESEAIESIKREFEEDFKRSLTEGKDLVFMAKALKGMSTDNQNEVLSLASISAPDNSSSDRDVDQKLSEKLKDYKKRAETAEMQTTAIRTELQADESRLKTDKSFIADALKSFSDSDREEVLKLANLSSTTNNADSLDFKDILGSTSSSSSSSFDTFGTSTNFDAFGIGSSL